MISGMSFRSRRNRQKYLALMQHKNAPESDVVTVSKSTIVPDADDDEVCEYCNVKRKSEYAQKRRPEHSWRMHLMHCRKRNAEV